ncbi:MAG TPA: UDP-2,4-diacetamido-2,4,6-trideoxy-beta-L-altropyranose hydrolase [Caulobacter sp.]|nr:UDP-2,4-diacetamido-2,4,6-trideoxy-beta-L-altropyranose hydrolase [Caulobacter sp.]
MRVLFACDAGPEVGGGHVMRCLTLAGALQARGLSCAFLGPPTVASLLDAFAPDMPRQPAAGTAPEALVAAIKAGPTPDLLVTDHYGFSADHDEALGDLPTLALDDLGTQRYADIVVNPGLTFESGHYDGLVPSARQVLLGPKYALVRPEFGALRPATLARRAMESPPARLLVSIGLGDLNGMTAWVLDTLAPMTGGLIVDVVLGSAAPSLPQVRAMAERHAALKLHIDSRDMAALMAAADISVGAGGSSAWERCVLGLPSVCLWLADNQRDNSFALEAAGAAIAIHGYPDQEEADELRRRFGCLLTDAGLRSTMSRAAAALCDGRGAERIADTVLAVLS